MYDLLITNALICDGSGTPGYEGSVAVKDGKIAAVGQVDAQALQVIDAQGLVLSPGFVEPHAHYDAQMTWDGLATPIMEHGVTAIVQGNCSLSLAPVREQDREFMAKTFRHIEEMPENAFDAGLKWSWETFDDYNKAISNDELGINVATLVGHSPLRLWVLGEESRVRSSTVEEITQLQQELRNCLDGGALGLSTSFVDTDFEQCAVPCRWAATEELDALCAVLGEYKATLQVVPEFWNEDLLCARIDLMADLSRKHGIKVTFSPLFDSVAAPNLVNVALERVKYQRELGGVVIPQVQTRPSDITFNLKRTSAIFVTKRSWWDTLSVSKEERIALYKNAEKRAELIEELKNGLMPIALHIEFDKITINHIDSDKNRQYNGMTLAQVAMARNCDIAEVMLDLSLEEDFEVEFTAASLAHDNPEKVADMLTSEYTMVGAGDAGAHVTRFATYGDTTYLFSKFVREQHALTIEQAVQKLTSETYEVWGIKNRGYLREGYAADMVIFDPVTIDRGPEVMAYDLPAEGFRYVREAFGIKQVFVNGQQTYIAGQGYTDNRAGEILRVG